jgi:hypothetical protein
VRRTHAFWCSGYTWASAGLCVSGQGGEICAEKYCWRGVDSFPYELTGGRVAGKTWVWRSTFEYRVTQFLQASMNYEGRSEGGSAPVHNARAEIRAFF